MIKLHINTFPDHFTNKEVTAFELVLREYQNETMLIYQAATLDDFNLLESIVAPHTLSFNYRSYDYAYLYLIAITDELKDIETVINFEEYEYGDWELLSKLVINKLEDNKVLNYLLNTLELSEFKHIENSTVLFNN